MPRPKKTAKKRTLGKGKAVQNPRAHASVMSVRAAEHAQRLVEISASKQQAETDRRHNQSLYDIASAEYGLYLSKGNLRRARMADAHMTDFQARKSAAALNALRMSRLASQVQSSLNSVVVEVARMVSPDSKR